MYKCVCSLYIYVCTPNIPAGIKCTPPSKTMQERPEERDIRAGAEDAEYRSASDAEKGERLLLESK